MMDTTGDWCYEGGCSYLTDPDITAATVIMNDLECAEMELEALYCEPCVGSFD